MMDFKQIEAFVNVVKYKGFSKAADATFLTQPTISAHISNLEKELGSSLINRMGREVSLTKQGELFYPYAVNLLQMRMEAANSVLTKDAGLTGVLDVQTSTIPGQYFLPQMMRGFHQLFPGVFYHVEQSDSKNVMTNILSQQGEIGFTGYQSNNRLIYEHIFTDEMMLLAPAVGRIGSIKGDIITLESFADEPFIIREEDSGSKLDLLEARIDGQPLVKEEQIIARMNNLEAIKQAVAAGLGVSIVSGCAARELAEKNRVRAFHIAGLEKKRNFYMVYNKNISLSPVAKAFRDYVLKERNVIFHG